MKQFLTASAAVVFLSLAAAAGNTTPPPVSDWAPDETVVVSAESGGPAYWHIKKGESEIYILGTVGDLPKDLAWNTAHTSEIIKGARVVLLPPQASAGFVSTGWFLLWNRSLLRSPDGKTLLETLSPDLRTKFAAEAATLKVEYESDDSPLLAAIRLENRFTDVNKLSNEEPSATVAKIARANHVPVQRIGNYDALGLVKELLRLPQTAQQACLSEAVNDVESRTQHVRPAAEAWASGDVKAIKAHYTPHVFLQCAQATASFNKLYDQAVADYLKAIADALAKPGKTVLMTDIGSLLRNTGVAEKLHAQGVIIEGPAE